MVKVQNDKIPTQNVECNGQLRMQDDHPYDMVDTETTSFIPSSYTPYEVQYKTNKYYYSERRITYHRRHPKLLYIIFPTPPGLLHAKSYSTSHTGRWKYNYYNTQWNYYYLSHLRSSSHRSLLHSLEVQREHPETTGPEDPVDQKGQGEVLDQQTVACEDHEVG